VPVVAVVDVVVPEQPERLVTVIVTVAAGLTDTPPLGV
jgi:hypothetical protein